MSVWKYIGLVYLLASLGNTLYWFIGFVREDIQMYRDPIRRSLSKFGYNLKWKGFGWWILLLSLPGCNLVFVVIFIINHEPYKYVSKKVRKLCSQRNQS